MTKSQNHFCHLTAICKKYQLFIINNTNLIEEIYNWLLKACLCLDCNFIFDKFDESKLYVADVGLQSGFIGHFIVICNMHKFILKAITNSGLWLVIIIIVAEAVWLVQAVTMSEVFFINDVFTNSLKTSCQKGCRQVLLTAPYKMLSLMLFCIISTVDWFNNLQSTLGRFIRWFSAKTAGFRTIFLQVPSQCELSALFHSTPLRKTGWKYLIFYSSHSFCCH